MVFGLLVKLRESQLDDVEHRFPSFLPLCMVESPALGEPLAINI
jgi:hypothetical protein